MKSFLILLVLLFSTLGWAGGPDIPWPNSIDGQDVGDDNKGGEPKSTEREPYLKSSYSLRIEKNDGATADDCPFIVIIEEIDLDTGEVIGEHQLLPCDSEILKLDSK